MKNKQVHNKGLIYIALMLLLLVVTVIGGLGNLPAFADTGQYTSVIEDLSKDEKFNIKDYPIDTSDYSLQVIQIAESEAGELFVYVYQPSAQTGNLKATDINMSLYDTVRESKLYSLKLVNSAGVYFKYLVENISVSDKATRYYNISSIYRAWDKQIDEGTGNDNTVNGVSFEVGQLWTVRTDNGSVNYEMTKTDVIEITDKYVGYIRYSNGFKLYKDSCDSHFIAFSTEYKIDSLTQADVSYRIRGCKVVYALGMETSRTYSDYTDKDITLDYNDIGGNRADGWWADKVEYHRIESAKEFAESEDFDKDTKAKLSKYQWVLRFIETSYQRDYGITALGAENYSEVSEVTILRLKFETDGVTYNLGVVDNKQTGSSKPIVEVPTQSPVADVPWWGWLIAGVAVLLVAVIVLYVLSLFFPVIKVVFFGIWTVITAPFRAIGNAVKKRDESRQPKKKTTKKKPGASAKKKSGTKSKAKPKAKNKPKSKAKTKTKTKKAGKKK